MGLNKILKLLGLVILCELLGNIGSLATFPSIPTWYATLNKPSFTPPNWLFGPAWTTLFALMGIALFLVLEKGWEKEKVKAAVYAFALQFIANILWSFAFFGQRSPIAGLIVIVILWVLILKTILRFYAVDKKAGLILLPYLGWVSFASVLNFAVWRLN